MDTRTKIVSAAESLKIASAGATVVSGIFDPIIAAHAERLHDLKRPGVPLLVLISPSPDEILSALARAQLLAGLQDVDYVAVAFAGAPAAHFALEQEDAERLKKLIEHVHTRQLA